MICTVHFGIRRWTCDSMLVYAGAANPDVSRARVEFVALAVHLKGGADLLKGVAPCVPLLFKRIVQHFVRDLAGVLVSLPVLVYGHLSTKRRTTASCLPCRRAQGSPAPNLSHTNHFTTAMNPSAAAMAAASSIFKCCQMLTLLLHQTCAT